MSASPANAPRQNENSWTGANLDHLQGLSDAKQDAYIEHMASAGAKVIRVWDKHARRQFPKGRQSPRQRASLRDDHAPVKLETLDALDEVIDKVARAGMKAIISPKIPPPCLVSIKSESQARAPPSLTALIYEHRDVYYEKWGYDYSYELEEAFDAYVARLSAMLNYSGKYSNKAWKGWNDGILSFNLQFLPDAVAECPTIPAQYEGNRFGILLGSGTDIETYLKEASSSPALQKVMATGNSPPLRIAIIGGGLAGATLANALIQIPHIDIQIYESAPSFSERGAAVGLGTNAQQALEHVLPGRKDGLLKRAGAVPMNSSRTVVGSGPYAGQTIFDFSGADPGIIVHRASLLRELVAPLPKDSLHSNKKLAAINPIPDMDAVEVMFEDRTVDTFDAVIGADGIFGSVRSYVLQDDADQFAASPAGFWDCRSLVPFERAKAVLGEELFELDRQYGWVGDGSGAAMAFEDAMILKELLGNITSSADIKAAFKAYDAVRRPRCQRVIDSSRETGLMLCGQHADAGLNPEKLRALLAPRWDFIYGLDMSAHKQEALQMLRKMQQSQDDERLARTL
ncbi:hypothetical protein DL770_008213 [Monosporascus sp. CRB-9-2]|nr:hypothetical protein DL770_008213 [Monosporascus sp. CRB-9-2]